MTANAATQKTCYRGAESWGGRDSIGHPDIEKTTLSTVLPMAYATRTGAGNITRGTWPGTFHPITSPTHSPATRSERFALGISRLDFERRRSIGNVGEAEVRIFRNRNPSLHAKQQRVALPYAELIHEIRRDIE